VQFWLMIRDIRMTIPGNPGDRNHLLKSFFDAASQLFDCSLGYA